MAKKLKLSFDPMTIEHLGFRMYSRLPNAVAELVANAYDADANNVQVELDTTGSQKVTVADDGHGMSRDDLADRYLRIGRNRRTDDQGLSPGGRRVAGRKGLGKLALFGIGKRITIRTKVTGQRFWTEVVMDWDEIKGTTGGDYHPRTTQLPANSTVSSGTTIVVEDLQRTSRASAADLARSLSTLFNYSDSGFLLTVSENGGVPIAVDRELRYSAITTELTWDVPIETGVGGSAPPISGKIFASKKPLSQNMRGITMYVKGRLANDAEFFGVSESSHAYSYLTGYIDADYLDDEATDVIATDRSSIDWEDPVSAPLRAYMSAALRAVSAQRKSERRKIQTGHLEQRIGKDLGGWVSTVQDEKVKKSLENVLAVVVSPDTDMSDDERDQLIQGLNEIAPEYADMHWRSLHPSVQAAAETLYMQENYIAAVVEAIKRYVKDVRAVSEIGGAEFNVLQGAFGGESPKVDVAAPYLPDTISETTAKNLRVAHRIFSEGIWQGFRDPIQHEMFEDLKKKGVFTYQDCLDALAFVSHLCRRLELAGTSGP
ncbi:TIGR02391 family protein [Promicromonospora soli]|uniref:Conserved hypothetical protein CHP02391 domain-containing protein n=1 Tax=Promicromonospora soli TaxID=2035533 RepID=A0A919FS86_9MICO|nr:TIGR02391 family protein [Promicromonospora soli]GHH71028.1 hypothetical protein GCM10017772_18660 [Promicromonospora soli]